MKRYIDQELKKANRNHYIVEVHDTLNPSSNPTWSEYFDGTQAAAIKHFLKQPKVKQYMNLKDDRYTVSMRGNSIVLSWSEEV